ncbi:LysR family transcriptional regulator [Lutibaculum baratangense]|uniref:Transcriptional regulator, LysR family n=1 Tax=Lutibaculum baratangense AMV1 TaxID=631454 RepID=V4QRZ3_9HYPH|nr:LysR family transcriptional regulator [Lutibaculum baratangense]ESR22522.1 transcriptional regulator, LysR family [Lutibaculum baratangense AMV1]
MRYEMRHLRAFITVAESLNFSRAAERLGTSQPALSRVIGELEQALGVRLFERTTRSVRLTEAGEVFLPETRATLRQAGHAEALAKQAAAGISGTIRIAYMDFAINGRLPELLKLFAAQHPDIRLDLRFCPTTVQQKALLEGSVDVGFLIGRLESDRIENYRFHEERYVVLLPSTHRLAHVRELELEALANEPFVMGSAEFWTAHRERVFLLCHQAGFFPEIVQEPSTSEGVFGLVAAGAGVSVYAECARNLQRRGLVIQNLANLNQTIPTYAAWDRRLSAPAVRRFVDFLKQVWGRPGAADGS